MKDDDKHGFEIRAYGTIEDRFATKPKDREMASFEQSEFVLTGSLEDGRERVLGKLEDDLPKGDTEQFRIIVSKLRITEFGENKPKSVVPEAEHQIVYKVSIPLGEHSWWTVLDISTDHANEAALKRFGETHPDIDFKGERVESLFAQRSWYESLREPLSVYGSEPMDRDGQVKQIRRIFRERSGRYVDDLVSVGKLVLPEERLWDNLHRVEIEADVELDIGEEAELDTS